MKFRFACRRDASSLAALHIQSSAKQPGGFMYQLGPFFLKRYYEVLIDEGSSLVLCAVDDNGKIIGFVSGSLDASTRISVLKRHRLSLFISLVPVFLRNPRLVSMVAARQSKHSGNLPYTGYANQSASHVDFWAWCQNSGGGAFSLLLKWLSIMRSLGAKTILGEVDKQNSVILKAHQVLGAKIVNEFTTLDNRIRYLIKYNF